jgi:prophage regulatory protein
MPCSRVPEASLGGASCKLKTNTSIRIAFEVSRLILDPGTRTLGEFMQEREWAVSEILRLRMDLGRLSRNQQAEKIEEEMGHRGGLDPKLHAQRPLRLADVSMTVGLKRSSIYRYVAEGRFPAPIKVGERSVRWKLADILAWRARVSE